MKVVIIGGVAGGATTAARLRRLDESAEIVILERGSFISYANCGLPYFVGGTIADREDLELQTPASFNARFAVDVRARAEAVKIDTAAKTVTVRNLDTGEETSESYDNLVIAGCGSDQGLCPDEKAQDGRCRRRRLYRSGSGGKSDRLRSGCDAGGQSSPCPAEY